MRTRLVQSVMTLAVLSILVVSVAPVTSAAAYASFGLEKDDFTRISTGGFGDTANSYAWGMGFFDGALYVGTNRHHLWSVFEGLQAGFGIDLPSIVSGPADPIGTTEWANEMRGEIWRYKDGVWEMVWQSEIMPAPQGYPIPGWYPVSYGYRMMGVFNGKLYVCGIGTWWPPMALGRVLVSSTGDFGDFKDVTGALMGTNNIRGLVEYQGKLYVGVSKPGASPIGAGEGVVYYSSNPETEGWTQVSSYGFGNSNNAEIPYLTVFNGYLYASTINYAEGFEVWKTDGTVGQDGYYVWENVVSDGYGDTWNQWGMTMKAFGDYLYVGTAVGAGIVLKDNQPVGTRAFDLIRIGKDDNVQLVVGAYVPSDPPDGWPTTRVPLSKWPAGFGNPLNVYVWHMEVLNGVLYLGTFDASSTLMKGLVTIIESLQTDGQVNGFSQQLAEIVNMPEVQSLLQQYPEYVQKLQQLVEIAQTADLETVMNTIAENFGGADLWKTNDGTRWVPITLNGFDDPNNYGIRRLVSVCNTYLFVGTANPYTDDPQGGCQVLEGVKPVHTVYQDGFETGSFSRWTGRKSSGGETAQVTSTLRHDGTYSARFTSDGSSRCEYSYAYKYVKSSTEVRAGGYFKVTSSGLYDGGDTAMLTALKEADGTPVAYGGLRRVCGSTRWVLTTRTSEGWVTTYSPCGMSTNQWYSVRIQWDGCALCQHAELVVNGKTVCSITGEDLGAYGPVGLVEVGLPQLIGCGSMKIYCDNIVISSRA